ncbi:olfactory receptor 5A2-like [Hyla sarda]|uniref:olfactory receptor 5A2-like n=1 Tax=Hyla sarda TaxID=327740 RepID=UPI0024C3B18B|nr:olfactory receptor 5A2-like [Hyla sarda]
MDGRNRTVATEFILMGFTKHLQINVVLFVIFSSIYLTTIVGNGLIICIIFFQQHLHTPMYYFLCNLAFIDFCYSSSTLPRLLVDLFSVVRSISLTACLTQVYVSLFLGETECFLLAVMAYDRYVAICHPLHYPLLMHWGMCHRLTTFSWVGSFTMSIVPSVIKPAELCYPNQVNHFMCEIIAMLKLACNDTHDSELMIFLFSFLSLLLPFLFIMVSYICILLSIIKMKSTGRSKAFSTCTSHITVVVLFYGTAMFMYFGPSSQYASNQAKYISIFYVAIIPMLNPLIYSLKNKEVLTAVLSRRK